MEDLEQRVAAIEHVLSECIVQAAERGDLVMEVLQGVVDGLHRLGKSPATSEMAAHGLRLFDPAGIYPRDGV